MRSLMVTEDPASNLKLNGGETIRVPDAGHIFVAGDVKHPGAFPITDGSESSVLKALALSQGLDSYSGHIAYIYRIERGSGHKNEIPVDVNKILARKSPDVPLYADDMLYVPTRTGMRASAKVLAVTIATGVSIAMVSIWAIR